MRCQQCLGISIKHPRKCAFCGAKQGDPKVILYPFPNDEVRMEWMDFVRRVFSRILVQTQIHDCVMATSPTI
jgi:hypothetical protein